MKKFYIGMLLSLLFIGNTNAQEIYYKNSNDVSFTKDEYNKISDFYWEGYQDYISVDNFEFLKNNGLFENARLSPGVLGERHFYLYQNEVPLNNQGALTKNYG